MTNWAEGELQAANGNFYRGIKMLQRLPLRDDPNGKSNREALALAFDRISSFFRAIGESKSARYFCHSALEARKEIVQECREERKLAAKEQEEEKESASPHWLEREYGITREPVKDALNDLIPMFRLSKNYRRLARLYGLAGDSQSEESLYKEFLRFAKSVAAEYQGVPEWLGIDVIECYVRLGDLQRAKRNNLGARRYVEAAIRLETTYIKRYHPTPKRFWHLGSSYFLLGEILKAQGDMPRANQSYGRCLILYARGVRGHFESIRDFLPLRLRSALFQSGQDVEPESGPAA